MRTLLTLLIIGSCCIAAPAATTVSMEVGWDKTFRVGRWTPIFITASDRTPRNILVELYVSHNQTDGIRIKQKAAIGAIPTTFAVYAPLGVGRDELSVVLRDPTTLKRLAATTSRDSFTAKNPVAADAASQLIVISGASDTDRTLRTQLDQAGVMTCRSISQIRLPSVALGYDAMNLLILDRPDMARLGADQQDALLDWIRAGGTLLCWFGPDALPSESSLLSALPATIGQNIALPVVARNISARELTPSLNAEKISLLDGKLIAYRRRFGFGSITMLPTNPSAFTFDDSEKWFSFWSPLLSGAINPRSASQVDLVSDGYADFILHARRQLGEPSPISSFDYNAIWLALIIAAGVVGPIDWFVLLMLNRRARTYTTIIGWIGFIVLAGVGIVTASIDEPKDARTIELIDQADGITVASIKAMRGHGIVSDSKDHAEQWWEPLACDKKILSSTPYRTDLNLHEDQQGARPITNQIDQSHPQMLLSQTITAAAPGLRAELHLEIQSDKPRIVGTITNLTASPLDSATIQTKNGSCVIASLPASGTVTINEPLTNSAISTDPLWNLAATRSSRIPELLKLDDQLACLTASNTDKSVHIRALISIAR